MNVILLLWNIRWFLLLPYVTEFRWHRTNWPSRLSRSRCIVSGCDSSSALQTLIWDVSWDLRGWYDGWGRRWSWRAARGWIATAGVGVSRVVNCLLGSCVWYIRLPVVHHWHRIKVDVVVVVIFVGFCLGVSIRRRGRFFGLTAEKKNTILERSLWLFKNEIYLTQKRFGPFRRSSPDSQTLILLIFFHLDCLFCCILRN